MQKAACIKTVDIMSEELMKIGEIAAFFDLSVKALRVYEKKGIIKPVKVDEATGYRYYCADQVKQLNALIDLQSLGFSLNEIKEIMDGKLTKQELVSKLEHKKWAWQETMMSAQNKMETLDDITRRLEQSGESAGLAEMTEDERAWLLVKMVCVENVKAQSTLSEAIWL